MTRRTLALAVALLLAWNSAARAEKTAALVVSVPAYLLTLAAIATGCIYDQNAEVDESYARDGWYLGMNGTTGFQDFKQPVANSVSGTVGWGVSGRAGYRCHPNVSVEVQYDWLTWSRISGSNLNLWQVTVNGKVYLPLLEKRLQPFLMSGFGAMHQNNAAAPDIRLGAGVDYYLTENVAVGADLSYLSPIESSHDDVGDLNHWEIGFGFQYRF